jgi:predicted nucleic acid-binding protein
MILGDTGFIVACLVRTDQHHAEAIELLKRLSAPLITTWPCLTEAMYLTGSTGGSNALLGLLRQVETGFLSLINLEREDALRACTLMRAYADTPMDFADASLVVAAERLGVARILTFDRHFYAYRINGQTPFEVMRA